MGNATTLCRPGDTRDLYGERQAVCRDCRQWRANKQEALRRRVCRLCTPLGLGWETTTGLREIALQARNKRSLLLAALFFSVVAIPAAEPEAAKDASSPCASFINSDFPKAVLSNGGVQVGV